MTTPTAPSPSPARAALNWARVRATNGPALASSMALVVLTTGWVVSALLKISVTGLPPGRQGYRAVARRRPPSTVHWRAPSLRSPGPTRHRSAGYLGSAVSVVTGAQQPYPHHLGQPAH